MLPAFFIAGQQTLEEEDAADSKPLEDLDFSDIEKLTLPKFKTDKDKKKKQLSKENLGAGLKIVAFDTNKSKIPQRPNMKNGIIPKHPGRVIFNGRSGSGKSNLIVSLLARPEFYGERKEKGHRQPKHYFEEIYLFSPTAGDMDDLPQHLLQHTPLIKKHIFKTFDEDMLFKIMDKQQSIMKNKGGIDKAPKVLVILDDIQSNRRFLRSDAILKIFLMGRHFGISVWLAGQAFNLTPRSCRLQASNVMIFPLTGSEGEVLKKEFKPSGMSNKDWQTMLKHVLSGRHDFLHINMMDHVKTRFRKNLDELLELKDF